jgi:hypothetical protein
MGDWLNVVQLLKSSGYGNDKLMAMSWNEIGNMFFDKRKWHEAVPYYTQSRNFEKLVDCYFYMEDFEALGRLVETIPTTSLSLFKVHISQHLT